MYTNDKQHEIITKCKDEDCSFVEMYIQVISTENIKKKLNLKKGFYIVTKIHME